MKTYQGHPTAGVTVVEETRSYPLPWRLDLRNHSPTGLSWGYLGSGPSQCALAILVDCMGDEFALDHYQDYKFDVISRLPFGEGWSLTDAQVSEWAKKHSEPDDWPENSEAEPPETAAWRELQQDLGDQAKLEGH